MNEFDHENTPRLVVMLTHNDLTVENAEEVFEECKDAPAHYWGMKEKPLPLTRMKALFRKMKDCGKCTVLEVVGYSEAEGLEGARIGAECGCDILMGTHYFKSIAEYCKSKGIRYMPFVGEIEGRPSVLKGKIEEIVREAGEIIGNDLFGIDLLGYRYEGDPVELNRNVVLQTKGNVCLAGSIDSYERIEEVKRINPWGFTIGSAFFEKKFGDTIPEQIARVDQLISVAEPVE